MSLQQIIDSAVNIEVNRSKQVAQTVSRNGRVSTASRNWNTPFRFTVTPRPVYTAEEYRQVFEPLLRNDRFLPHGFFLNNLDPTTFLATLGNNWMVNYQGNADTTAVNNIIDSYEISSQTTGAQIALSNVNSANITPGVFLVKAGDYIRPELHRYPYIATADVVIPTTATDVTGVIQPAGITATIEQNQPDEVVGLSVSFVTTPTRTIITGIASTLSLSVGQIITKTAGTGALGGLTYIAEINGLNQITIQSTTACTSGTVTFDGSGNTSTPTVMVPVNRGFIGTVNANTPALVGARAAQFVVIVTQLPQIRYLPGRLVELTSDIELIEEII